MFMISNLPEDIYLQQLNVEDALAVANYPTSGSYIDVSGYVKFGFLIMAGGLDSATTCAVYQDTAATETASIKAVSGATTTIAADGDDHWHCIEVETNELDISNDFHFVTLTVSGPAGGNDYAAIMFYGIPAIKPVTQHSTEGETVLVNGS